MQYTCTVHMYSTRVQYTVQKSSSTAVLSPLHHRNLLKNNINVNAAQTVVTLFWKYSYSSSAFFFLPVRKEPLPLASPVTLDPDRRLFYMIRVQT